MPSSFQVRFYSDLESDSMTTKAKISMTSLESGVP